tara:strand:+ start:850 stop:1011 length:162 start_codon:yes stop_codon:yes gene_type:complete
MEKVTNKEILESLNVPEDTNGCNLDCCKPSDDYIEVIKATRKELFDMIIEEEM